MAKTHMDVMCECDLEQSGCGKGSKGLGRGRDKRHQKMGVIIKVLSVYHLDKMLFSNAQ